MNMLKVGDTFHHKDYGHDAYEVIKVSKDRYTVKQPSEQNPEYYKFEVVHKLFRGENPWVLHRKNHLPEELFEI